jgi:RNA polymerase sigma-B factor
VTVPSGVEGGAARVLDPRFAEYRTTGDHRIRDELVEANIGLARHLARRFAHRGEPQEELEQVALVGLLKSVERFEPERGAQFSTFAVPTIVGELKRHFRDRGWAVRVPRRVQELYLEVGATVARLSQDLGHSPTPVEVAGAVGVPVETVIEALEAGDLYHLASLDEPGEQSRPREPAAPDPFVPLEQRMAIEEMLATLPARDRLIVELRFFDGLTQSEIAERVGISQMHVSRLLTRSLQSLRSHTDAP